MTQHHIPQHIGIIMDGNNRWAKLRGKRKLAGHAAGADSLRSVTRKCLERGVHSLSIFAFSSENWNRPKLEVDGLMRLFERALIDELSELIENDISVVVIGDRSRFASSLIDAIERAEAATARCNRLKLNILANYGGRWDIADTAKRLASEVLSGRLALDSIDEYLFDNRHNLANQPSVDLLIRTGGEHRISNFLLWQSAYAELIFSDILWPDFDGEALDSCLTRVCWPRKTFW